MDQLKEFLAMLRRHHFWVLCGTVAIVGLVGWYMAQRSLSEEYDAQMQRIKKSRDGLQTVANQPDHPNDTFHDGMQQALGLRREDVRRAWAERHAQLSDILVWPEELGEDFLKAVAPLTPIEQVPVDSEPLRFKLRERYRDYIKEELPKLAEMIGAEWDPDEGGGGAAMLGAARAAFGHGGAGGGGGLGDNALGGMGMGGGGARPKARGPRKGAMGAGAIGGELGGLISVEEEPLVYWDPGSQGFIEAAHFDWSSEADNTPNTLQVLYAQEDLWVLRALLEVIRRTNGDVQEHHRAAVKEIQHIRIGMFAGGRIGQVTRIGTAAGGSGRGMGGFGGEFGVGGAAMPPGTGGAGGPGMPGAESGKMRGGLAGPGDPNDPNFKIDPAEGRYVDSTHTHIPASTLRNPTAPAGPDAEVLGVAKRMPVRMRLVVDQRSLYKLLVECANSPLTVEIHQVRFNPESISQLSGGGMGMGGLMGGGQKPKREKRRRGAGMGAGFGGAAVEIESTFDITVELYGMIHIYNPVNRQLLRDEPEAAVAQEQPMPGAPGAPGAIAGG